MITTLLWDLDNTLLDFPSAERQALIATFADFTLGPCSPDLLVRYSALNARWWRRLEEGKVTKAELLPGRFREFFAAEGIACTEYDAFNAAYQHHLGDTIVFLDNGYELVKDLHGQVKQYLVTNGSLQAQTRKLKRSGLGELFDGVFISEVVGAEKPSRAFSTPCSPPSGRWTRRSFCSSATPSPATWPEAAGRASPAAGTTPRACRCRRTCPSAIRSGISTRSHKS